MKLVIQSALMALAATVLTAGTALAAEDCCCKDKDGKMSCCDKKPDAAPATSAPAAGAPATPHQH